MKFLVVDRFLIGCQRLVSKATTVVIFAQKMLDSSIWRNSMLAAEWSPASRARLTFVAIAVFVVYYLCARLGFALTFAPSPISVLWPPNSILFAALLLVPATSWWLVMAAALPAHLLAELQGGVPLSMVVSWFVS